MFAMPAVNWLAIVVAAVIQFVVGFLWYSPMLFGNQWMKLSGIKPDPKVKPSAMMMPMVGMFVLTLITAFVLSGFIGYAGAKGAVDGALVGVMAWLGFMATTHASSVLFERKPKALYVLNVGHMLAAMALAGAILGYWA